jgi:hypothetical protein
MIPKKENTAFQKLDLCPASSEEREVSTLLGPVVKVSSF